MQGSVLVLLVTLAGFSPDQTRFKFGKIGASHLTPPAVSRRMPAGPRAGYQILMGAAPLVGCWGRPDPATHGLEHPHQCRGSCKYTFHPELKNWPSFLCSVP